MDEEFKNSPAGKILRTNRDYHAFVPNPLPPEIQYTKELVNLPSQGSGKKTYRSKDSF